VRIGPHARDRLTPPRGTSRADASKQQGKATRATWRGEHRRHGDRGVDLVVATTNSAAESSAAARCRFAERRAAARASR
jgi:hypothetical protein